MECVKWIGSEKTYLGPSIRFFHAYARLISSYMQSFAEIGYEVILTIYIVLVHLFGLVSERLEICKIRDKEEGVELWCQKLAEHETLEYSENNEYYAFSPLVILFTKVTRYRWVDWSGFQ